MLIGTSYTAVKVFPLLFDDRDNLLFLHNKVRNVVLIT
jgi:hypothetical protein